MKVSRDVENVMHQIAAREHWWSGFWAGAPIFVGIGVMVGVAIMVIAFRILSGGPL